MVPWKVAEDKSLLAFLSPTSPWDLSALMCCLRDPFESHLSLLCPPTLHKAVLLAPGLQDALVLSVLMLASGLGHPKTISDLCQLVCIS